MERLFPTIEDQQARDEAIYIAGIENIEKVKAFFSAIKRTAKEQFESMDERSRAFNGKMYTLGIKIRPATWIWKNIQNLDKVDINWFDGKFSETCSKKDLYELFINAVLNDVSYDELITMTGIEPVKQKGGSNGEVNLEDELKKNRVINQHNVDIIRNMFGFKVMLDIKSVISNKDLHVMAVETSDIFKNEILGIKEMLNKKFGGYEYDMKYAFNRILMSFYGINLKTASWLFDHAIDIDGEEKIVTAGWFYGNGKCTNDERYSILVQMMKTTGSIENYVKFITYIYNPEEQEYPDYYAISPEAIRNIDAYYARIGKESPVSKLKVGDLEPAEFLSMIDKDVLATVGKWFDHVWANIRSKNIFIDTIGMSTENGFHIIDETTGFEPRIMHVWFKSETVESNYPLFVQIAKLATETDDLSLFDAYIIANVTDQDEISSLGNVLYLNEHQTAEAEAEAEATGEPIAFPEAILNAIVKQDPENNFLPREAVGNAVELGTSRIILLELGTVIRSSAQIMRPGKNSIKTLADDLIYNYGFKPKTANALAEDVGFENESIKALKPDMFKSFNKEVGVDAADLYNLLVTLIDAWGSNGISLYRAIYTAAIPDKRSMGNNIDITKAH